MTVCIAALCEDQKTIVLAADRMISTRAFQADLAISKMRPIHAKWCAMIAANDLAPVFPILDRADEVLAGLGHDPSVEEVANTLEAAFSRERQHRAERAALQPYGMTMRQFVSEGRQKLGDSLFERMVLSIIGATLECELLVAGFGPDGVGHILSVRDPGVADRQDLPGFYAIGSGATNAAAWLYLRAQDYTDPFWLVLYQTNEAKIYGALSPGVGYDTELIILRPTGTWMLTGTEVKAIDKIWEKDGQPRLPNRLKQRMARFTELPEQTDEADSPPPAPEAP